MRSNLFQIWVNQFETPRTVMVREVSGGSSIGHTRFPWDTSPSDSYTPDRFWFCNLVYTEKSFPYLSKSIRNQIGFIIFDWFGTKTDVHLVQNLSGNSKYNRISVWFNKISLCVPDCKSNINQTRLKSLENRVYPIEDPLKPLGSSWYYRIEGVRRTSIFPPLCRESLGQQIFFSFWTH